MKLRVKTAVVCGALLGSLCSVAYGDSFRTYDGKLIKSGMSKGKLVAVLGEPQSKQIDSLGINHNAPTTEVSDAAQTIESWIYTTQDSFNVDRIVTVTLEAGVVSSVLVEKFEDF